MLGRGGTRQRNLSKDFWHFIAILSHRANLVMPGTPVMLLLILVERIYPHNLWKFQSKQMPCAIFIIWLPVRKLGWICWTVQIFSYSKNFLSSLKDFYQIGDSWGKKTVDGLGNFWIFGMGFLGFGTPSVFWHAKLCPLSPFRPPLCISLRFLGFGLFFEIFWIFLFWC